MNWPKTRLDRFLRQAGSPFHIGEEEAEYRGVFSPRFTEDAGKVIAEPMGRGVQGRLLLLTSADVPGLVKGAVLTAGEQVFYVERAGVYTLCGKPLYQRASLRPERKEATP